MCRCVIRVLGLDDFGFIRLDIREPSDRYGSVMVARKTAAGPSSRRVNSFPSLPSKPSTYEGRGLEGVGGEEGGPKPQARTPIPTVNPSKAATYL